ncbi:hypothetical protein M441DRAFT_59067 [Trichoderma asperellum CBS 433.97]|uniref:Uncharacterized protein n=1 Tax=Trichoderma asperellum (strain ATCC 204424 / CBS 433.97 / NBRC 101777) TaxID=1042311 RepID=A0A2T3Z629_TRIA4|nr:hypothetical protein M441DRAFT_59067 [Trichoderma asperellum CBS 433.97]PTB40268.1 hypothetical protein M441DRAFT_59067 [Trichoderma asperellum CBS 433.97]
MPARDTPFYRSLASRSPASALLPTGLASRTSTNLLYTPCTGLHTGSIDGSRARLQPLISIAFASTVALASNSGAAHEAVANAK